MRCATSSPARSRATIAPIARITTDTRRIAPGDCFVALIGERFDAHDFLREAIDLGATAVIVSRPGRTAGLGVPVFAVQDTLVALGALARYRRRAWSGTVIGVGGSNGKTTTKELIRATLGATLTVHATTGNLNNLVGVPLTLLAMPDDADVAVIEMGMNVPGEMARLRGIVEADIVVMTSVSEEHLEGLGESRGRDARGVRALRRRRDRDGPRVAAGDRGGGARGARRAW